MLFASVESLPVGLHARGEAKNEAREGVHIGVEVLRAVGEAEEVVVVERVAHGGHERIDALDDVFVFRPATAGGKFAESGFFARLDVEQTGGSDAGVHAAEVFHHVAELHVLAGVLERGGFVAVHERLHEAEFGFSGEVDGLIDALAAQAHLRSGEETAGAAGEAHDHGVVAVFDAAQTDGQPLVAVQRHVGFGVARGASLGIGVDAEHRKVGIVARPHPIVLVEAELGDLLGRVHHQTDVVVALFDEEEIAIASEEGDNARTHAGRLGVGAGLEQRFGQGAEHGGRLALVLVVFLLAREGLDARCDIVDADHEGEGEAGHGQLLGAALGEEAVLEIIVLEVAHLVHKGEAAVVVGEDESVGADDFAGASAAETADDIAERGAVVTVEGFGGELQSGFAERVGEVLLLHEFEQPHALVGTGYRERKEGEESKNDSTHGEEEKKVENEMKKMGRKCARVRGFGPKTGDFALRPGAFPPDEGRRRRRCGTE